MNQIKAALFGLAVGDALGVRVEFRERDGLRNRPVTDMIGHGTHNQLPGTWSDKWQYGGRDISVNVDGADECKLREDHILLTDSNGE